MKKAAVFAVLVALALPAAVLAQTPYLHNAPSDAARPVAAALENPIYLHSGPSDAAVPASPAFDNSTTYLQSAPSDAAGPQGPAVTPAAPSGFDWGDALIGAGVAVGAIVLLAMAATTLRHYTGHGRGGLATGH